MCLYVKYNIYSTQYLLKKIKLFSTQDLTAGFTEKVACKSGGNSVSLFGSHCRRKAGIFTGFLTLMEQHFTWRDQCDQTCSGRDGQSAIFLYLESIETLFLERQISSEMQVQRKPVLFAHSFEPIPCNSVLDDHYPRGFLVAGVEKKGLSSCVSALCPRARGGTHVINLVTGIYKGGCQDSVQ